MSENEKWEEKVSKIVETAIEKKLKDFKPTIPPILPLSTPEKEEHPTHSLEDLLSCPDCGPKVIKAVLEKEKKRRDELPYVCETCGTGVEQSEEQCPSCGGTEARNR